MGTKYSTQSRKISADSFNSGSGSSRQATSGSSGSVRSDNNSEDQLRLPKESPHDQKATLALQKLRHSYVLNEKKIPFTRILLKFPQAAKAFSVARSTFKKYDQEGQGYIVYKDLPTVFKELGVSFSEDEINQAFEESNLKENGKLNFKELLVSLAVGFLLLRISSSEKNRLSVFYTSQSDSRNNSFGKIHNIGGNSTGNTTVGLRDDVELWGAFQLAIDCFLWFDTEGSGYINRNDMSVQLETSMARHSPTKKLKKRSGSYKGWWLSTPGNTRRIWSIWDRRFAEMDWNRNGTIHFNEFLMAFESWVGIDDDDDSFQQEEKTERETSTAQ
ncbi:hypothetical protein V7S43_005947 [Phytophthora oleae]|uniref:EF-hand domain-containing protein n=1 Tax=Phytophthora oleae TaxID=2107226 RepID=A0ABD3FPF3_9STRA